MCGARSLPATLRHRATYGQAGGTQAAPRVICVERSPGWNTGDSRLRGSGFRGCGALAGLGRLQIERRAENGELRRDKNPVFSPLSVLRSPFSFLPSAPPKSPRGGDDASGETWASTIDAVTMMVRKWFCGWALSSIGITQ